MGVCKQTWYVTICQLNNWMLWLPDLVGALEHLDYCSHHIGVMSSSQLTNIFQRGRLNHQPVIPQESNPGGPKIRWSKNRGPRKRVQLMVVVATGNVHILRISKNLNICDYIEHSSAALNVMFVVKIPAFAGCTVFDCSLMLFIVVCNVSKIGPLISDMMPLWSAVFFSQQALFSEKPELELMINQNLVDG